MNNLKLLQNIIIQSQQTHKRGKQTIAKVFSAAHCRWACQYCFNAVGVTAFLGQCAIVHIQEHLGCMQLREFMYTLCAIKRI